MIELLDEQLRKEVLELENLLNLSQCVDSMNTSTLVLSENGKLIGFLVWSENEDFAELLNIGIALDYQRKHFGYKLVTEWMRQVKAKGFQSLFCEVRSSNHAAVRLYEKVGFKVNRIRRDYYDNPQDDALEMRYDYE